MKKNKKFQINHVHLFTLAGIFTLMSVMLVACKNLKEDTGSNPDDIFSKGKPQVEVNIGDKGFYNFGDPNFAKMAKKINVLKKGKAEKETVFSVLQFGDSHTASDTITAHLRQQFRKDIGDAGIGWITPMNVSGQRHGLVSFSSQGWNLISSRTTKIADFPLGGFIATPTKNDGTIRVASRENSQDAWIARFIIKGSQPLMLTDANGRMVELKTSSSNMWEEVSSEVTLPFTINSNSTQTTQLGGIWLRKKNASGVEISPVGANGVQQIVWRRWSDQWTEQLKNSKTDLIILSYGTNEAFNSNLDVNDMKNSLQMAVRMIRKSLPDSAIVIVGAPDSMRKNISSNLECTQRQPNMLHSVKRAQLEIAQKEKTLYWDWQGAMGGDCGMLLWNRMQLTANDLVHFNNLGYKRSAEIFYEDFMGLVGKN